MCFIGMLVILYQAFDIVGKESLFKYSIEELLIFCKQLYVILSGWYVCMVMYFSIVLCLCMCYGASIPAMTCSVVFECLELQSIAFDSAFKLWIRSIGG